LTKNKIIEFIRKKDFKLIEELNSGSFGKTVLLQDDNINHKFVCKKYEPQTGINKKEYYNNFINEIKLLHLLYNDNIVRIFNYYLYPEKYTGYIMMEHVKGQDIYSYLREYPENLNNIFEQTIKGFVYLEKNKILHRDIRPGNIMVNENSIVKIIDFGFGKKINFQNDNQKSISINWWGNILPNDFDKKIYDNRTEIFFVGMLFQDIIQEIDSSFKYKHILKKMVNSEYDNRINSFNDILKSIVENDNNIALFTSEEKKIYQDFANIITESISEKENSSKVIMDIDAILKDLEDLKQKTMLEDYVKSKSILKILVIGQFKYYEQNHSTKFINDFFQFFKSISKEKQNIVLYNLETRLDNIRTYYNEDDEIPF